MQTHVFVQKSRAGAQAKNLLAGSQLVEAAGFAGTPTRSGDSLNPAWSPDGKFLVFNATTNLDEAAHARVNYHLGTVPVTGGEPQQITDSDNWSFHNPMFSNDGKALYCEYDPKNEYVYNLNGVGRFDWSSTCSERDWKRSI